MEGLGAGGRPARSLGAGQASAVCRECGVSARFRSEALAHTRAPGLRDVDV